MSLSKHTVGRKEGIPLPLIEQRKTCIVGLHLSGFSVTRIQAAVASLHSVFGWGVVSVRQVQRCLRQHFEGRPLTTEQVKSASSLQREAAIGQMEQCQEDIALYGFDQRTKNTKNYLRAMVARAYVIQCIINARGFNMSASDYGHWAAGTPMSMRKYLLGLELAGGKRQIIEKMVRKHDKGNGIFPY